MELKAVQWCLMLHLGVCNASAFSGDKLYTFFKCCVGTLRVGLLAHAALDTCAGGMMSWWCHEATECRANPCACLADADLLTMCVAVGEEVEGGAHQTMHDSSVQHGRIVVKV